jgi:hypothetical protein
VLVTHPVPCNGLIFPSFVELNTTGNWYCAVVTQRTHLLDVLSRPFFLLYIAHHDPAISTLKVKLLDYLNNTGLGAGWEAGSKLPFDAALEMLDGLDGTCKNCTRPALKKGKKGRKKRGKKKGGGALTSCWICMHGCYFI